MKRGRDEGEVNSFDMDNCLMLLSKVGEMNNNRTRELKGGFKCKTCSREFSSFQALGGHRASHKKPKLTMMMMMGSNELALSMMNNKPKMHECHICGLEFGIGQALGGHMRKHRAAMNDGLEPVVHLAKVDDNSKGINNYLHLDLNLNLNLTPLENDDLKLDLRPPLVHCFF